jgi:hypothetical protein
MFPRLDVPTRQAEGQEAPPQLTPRPEALISSAPRTTRMLALPLTIQSTSRVLPGSLVCAGPRALAPSFSQPLRQAVAPVPARWFQQAALDMGRLDPAT